MRIDALGYDLPPELIAQRPAEEREAARLLVLGADGSRLEKRIADLPEALPSGALLVVNDTRVVPARLLGQKRPSGGRVEIFLVRKMGERSVRLDDGSERRAIVWRALGRASKALRDGMEIAVGVGVGDAKSDAKVEAPLVVKLLGRAADGLLEVALCANADDSDDAVDALIHAHGHVPLPPYIKRDDDSDDRARYQTVFARVDGAVAAPTAGLHLTHALLERIKARGATMASVTLHVGLGTFQPVTVDDLDDHPMHSEEYEVSTETALAVASARERGAPVIAVGTTVARALESAADPERVGHVRATRGDTRLLIQPGYRFRVVDALLTNFHLPRSTLLAMVCAFAGTERVLDAYRFAVERRYRFFSYGDAMLLNPGA
jgi:S-adenosylmethionine:tRNA ribosyltransferase-isomerase